VFRFNSGNMIFGSAACCLGRQHNCSAVSIVGANVATVVSPRSVETLPRYRFGFAPTYVPSAAARWHKAMPKSPVFVLGSQSW
jgi:hypothetical protein